MSCSVTFRREMTGMTPRSAVSSRESEEPPSSPPCLSCAGVVHGIPHDHVGPGDCAGMRRRPLAGPLVPGVGPGEDLRDRRKPPISWGCIGPGVRRGTGGSSAPPGGRAGRRRRRRLDGQPGLARRLGDRPGPPRRPLAGRLVVSIGPGEDLVFAQLGRLAPLLKVVLHPAPAQETEPAIDSASTPAAADPDQSPIRAPPSRPRPTRSSTPGLSRHVTYPPRPPLPQGRPPTGPSADDLRGKYRPLRRAGLRPS